MKFAFQNKSSVSYQLVLMMSAAVGPSVLLLSARLTGPARVLVCVRTHSTSQI